MMASSSWWTTVALPALPLPNVENRTLLDTAAVQRVMQHSQQ